MKLCPQCEFIYEDDQNLCDMDGEALVYDPRLGVSPGTVPAVTGARPRKSGLRIIVLALVAGFVLSALLSLAYYASSPLFKSNVASPGRKPEASETSLQRQIAPPLDNSSSQPATNPSPSPTSPEAASESGSISADELTEKPASQSARSHVASKADNTPKAGDNRLTIARRLPPLPHLTALPELPPLKRLPAAEPDARVSSSTKAKKKGLTSQKVAMASQKASIVEVKPASGNATRRSRLGAFLKKTGRILKKPFKF